MIVAWYYTSAGKRIGPVAWDGIREAVACGAITADSFVWTPSFGTEWRKASTLTGLFPPPESKSEAEEEYEEYLAKESPYGDLDESEESELLPEPDRVPDAPHRPLEKPNSTGALLTAWHYMNRMLFGASPFRRWILLGICLMLTPMFPLIPAQIKTDEGAISPKIAKLGLEEILTTGIFDPEFAKQAMTNPENSADAMHATALAFADWLRSPAFMSQRFTIYGSLFAALMIWAWLRTRGTALFIRRVMNPDELLSTTWTETSGAASRLFLCMFLLKTAIFAGAFFFVSRSLDAAPFTPEKAVALFSHIFLFMIANMWLDSFVVDFVAPRMVLLG